MNVMIDIETLGTAPGSVILSLGAVAFDNNNLGQTFYRVINRQSSEEAGLTADEDTLRWWSMQSPEARKILVESGELATSSVLGFVCSQFNQFLRQHRFSVLKGADVSKFGLWGNGSDFDNVLLHRAFKAANVFPNWKYPSHRCYRTLKNLCPHIPLAAADRHGTHHNALDDAISQAKHLQVILRELQIELPPLPYAPGSFDKTPNSTLAR